MRKKNIFDVNERRVKSVIKPSAQSPVLCKESSFQSLSLDPFMSDVVNTSMLSVSDKAVIELLYYFGLRISEVLNIKKSDITHLCHIMIHASKNSKDRIVQPFIFRQFWLNATPAILPLGDTYSRFYFYRLFRKLGYHYRFGDNKKFSVTHFFRHQLILSFKSAGFSDEVITQFISHKSFDSLTYYAGKKR